MSESMRERAERIISLVGYSKDTEAITTELHAVRREALEQAVKGCKEAHVFLTTWGDDEIRVAYAVRNTITELLRDLSAQEPKE